MKKKRIVIVDGYNVIHRAPELRRHLARGLLAAREALMRYCAAWIFRRRDVSQVCVVFDGDSSVVGFIGGTDRGVRAVFTGTGEEADDRILDIIRKSRRAVRYIVVSDDNYVSRTSRRFMAEVMSVSEFYRASASRRARRRPEREDDIETGLSPGEASEITEEMEKEWGIR